MVKIRLHGLPDEVSDVLEQLRPVLNVFCISPMYADKGNSEYYRQYVDVAVDDRIKGKEKEE